MGISTAGHLPSITSTSYPALTSHLISAYNAQKIGNWTVSVRVFRSILSVENQDGKDEQQSILSQSQPQTQTQTKMAKLMYVVQMSEFPNETFVLVEDSQRETRASVRAKHAMSVMQAAAVAAVSSQEQENSLISQQTEQVEKSQNEMNDASEGNAKPTDSIQTEKQEEAGGGDVVKMAQIEDGENVENKEAEQNGEKEKMKETGDGESKVGTTEVDADQQQQQQQQDHSTDDAPSATEIDDLFSDPPNSSGPQHTEQAKAIQIPASQNETNPVFPTIDFTYISERPTRHTLFATSAHYLLLLSRLNLPTPLGANSAGGESGGQAINSGPGAWIPRGAPVSVQGTTYDIPSATGYGSGDAEWRVRIGMVQSSGTRNAGAMVENEYLPLLRLASDSFLANYLQNLFPSYLLIPSQNGAATQPNLNLNGGILPNGIAHSAPTPEQWQEVIPASNQAWMQSVGIASTDGKKAKERHRLPLQEKDRIGWQGKERGRRLAYLYITLLRNQSII